MAWELEIHHIDVTMTGDCTLIVARDVAGGRTNTVRTALVDGGRQGAAGRIYDYLLGQLGPAGLVHALIVTHYDNDHYKGIPQLLLQPRLFNDVRIYDQGWPEDSGENDYNLYLKAINGLNLDGKRPRNLVDVNFNRTRVTSAVYSGSRPPMLGGVVRKLGAPALPAVINQPPYWLLTAAAPADILWYGAPGGRPAGAPSMQCIAVNKYVRTAGGMGGPYSQGVLALDPRNEQSLAFLLTFGNFKYYLGGDIETTQENEIQLYLNATNDAAGRVVAFKASHHGANTATSRMFVDRLRPQAVLISCGTCNQYSHPAQETMNVIDGYPANPDAPDKVKEHPAPPPAPPQRPIENYLTGYQVKKPALMGNIGLLTAVAGNPNATPPIPGDLVLRVSAAQSATDQRGRLYRGVMAAATGAASAAGVASAMAGPAATAAASAAAEAALSFGPGGAALAFLRSAGYPAVPPAVATAISAQADAPWDDAAPASTADSAATAVTTAAIAAGVTNGPAAGTGAVMGAAIDGGEATGVQAAVRAALISAGLAPGPAGTAGTSASLAVDGTTLFDLTFYNFDIAAGSGAQTTEQKA